MMKKIALLLVLVMALGLFTGCVQQTETQKAYQSAQDLLAQGQYAQAADAFAALGSYEDAASLSLYAKTVAAGEGGSYADAAAMLAAMNGFKDSGVLAVYYQARALEAEGWESAEEAAKLYESIPLFRDSAERAKACREAKPDTSAEETSESLTAEEKYLQFARSFSLLVSTIASDSYDISTATYDIGLSLARELAATENVWEVKANIPRNTSKDKYNNYGKYEAIELFVKGYRSFVDSKALLDVLYETKPEAPEKYKHLDAKIVEAYQQTEILKRVFTQDLKTATSVFDHVWSPAEDAYWHESIQTLKGLLYIDTLD